MADGTMLTTLQGLAGVWNGNGVAEGGEPFIATFTVRGALAGRGVAMSFEARTESKELVRAEELLCVPAEAAYDPPAAVYVGTEGPPMHLQGAEVDEGLALATAATSGEEAFRVRFLPGDDGLIVAWDWEGSDGSFGERIRASLTRG